MEYKPENKNNFSKNFIFISIILFLTFVVFSIIKFYVEEINYKYMAKITNSDGTFYIDYELVNDKNFNHCIKIKRNSFNFKKDYLYCENNYILYNYYLLDPKKNN